MELWMKYMAQQLGEANPEILIPKRIDSKPNVTFPVFWLGLSEGS